jgi:hypothetical protein
MSKHATPHTFVAEVELGLLAADLDCCAVKLSRCVVLAGEAAQVDVLATAVDGSLPALVLLVPAHAPA